MDWIAEAVENLQRYEEHKGIIKQSRAELKQLEEDLARVPTNDALTGIIDLRNALQLTLRISQYCVQIVDSGLSILDDEGRLGLDRFYIHRCKGGVNQLDEEIFLEKTTLYKRRNKALRRFTLALYGALET